MGGCAGKQSPKPAEARQGRAGPDAVVHSSGGRGLRVEDKISTNDGSGEVNKTKLTRAVVDDDDDFPMEIPEESGKPIKKMVK